MPSRNYQQQLTNPDLQQEKRKTSAKSPSSNPFADDDDIESDSSTSKRNASINPFGDSDLDSDTNDGDTTAPKQRRQSLPPPDTPLGRYLRMQVNLSSPSPNATTSLQALIDSLPSPSYLEKDYDPLPAMMNSVPWGSAITSHLQDRILSTDNTMDAVQTR